jgi:dienelactone hydrolase
MTIPSQGPLTLVLSVLVTVLSTNRASAQPRTVDLAAADGVTLKATIFSAASLGPGVLLLHQCNRQRTAWNDLAQRLSSAGFHVLTMDLRGFGDSGGGRFGQLPRAEQQKQQRLWPADIDVAFQYLIAQPNVARTIGVGGASCGVNNAVQTARRHAEVQSLVLLSGTTDLEGRRFLRGGRRIPAFLALADDDEFPVSVATTQWLYSLTGTTEKKLVRYANGGHGADMFRPHPELMRAIVDWFGATLLSKPDRAPIRADSSAVAKESELLAMVDEPGGTSKVAQLLVEARRRDPKAAPFPEELVNTIGYDHLQSGNVTHALEVFRLNVDAFPNSPNAYDSLADAYLEAGQKDQARLNAQKALDLLPSATDIPQGFRDTIRQNAEQKLKQLGAPQR